MFTTKVINIETTPMDSFLFPLIRTKSLSINTRMNVYANYSRVSSAVKRSLNLLGMGESTSVKLSELRDTINIYPRTDSSNGQHSPTGRRQETLGYPYSQRLSPMMDWSNIESNELISLMNSYADKIRHDHQRLIEQVMTTNNCNRSEAKARTLGIRYGMSENVFNRGKGFPRGFAGDVSISDFGTLERRICGNKITHIIVDDYLGPKDL